MLQSPERTPRQNVSLFFLVWTACFLAFSLLTQGFLMVYFGKEGYNAFIAGTSFSPQDIEIVRYVQIFYSIGIFGVPPFILIFLNKPRDWSFIKMNRLPNARLWGLTLLVALFSIPVVAWMLEVNQAFEFPSAFQQFESYLREMEEQSRELLKSMLNMGSNYDFIITFFMIAIVPPVVEELLFRGTMQQLLQKQMGPHVAIFVTGAFFSFVHGDFYGFLPRMMLGILFGYLFLWSGSLWVPIFAHLLHNGLQVVMLFLFQRGVIGVDIEQVESFPPYITMGATILLLATLSIFDYAAQCKKTNDGERLDKSLHDK